MGDVRPFYRNNAHWRQGRHPPVIPTAIKLTAVVNIAVFAAFHTRMDGPMATRTEFKPVRADRQLDVSCYGWQKWQKWQDVARNGNGDCRFWVLDGKALARMRHGGDLIRASEVWQVTLWN